MQYLSIFLVLFYVFGGAIGLVLYGTKIVLLDLKIVIPFSHNITTSLCCCNVDRFILVVVIMKYDYKLALNTIIIFLFMVSICKP
jgi:hypothetical protein